MATINVYEQYFRADCIANGVQRNAVSVLLISDSECGNIRYEVAVNFFPHNAPDDFAISYVPGKGERSASEAIGGISMGYFITRKAWDDPAKREAAVEFVSQLTSDEVLSTFVTTEVTALVNGASPAGLNPLQQSAADANANITAIAGAVQDLLTAEARGDLFANVQNIVTGKISAEDAVAQAIALN